MYTWPCNKNWTCRFLHINLLFFSVNDSPVYLKLLLHSHLTTSPPVHGAGSLLLPQNFRGGPEGGSYMLVMLTFNKLSYLYLGHLCAKIMTSRLLSTPHLDLQLLY